MIEQWLSWQDLADVALATLLIFALLSRLRSRKSMLVVMAFASLGLAYVVSRAAGLFLVSKVLLALLVSGLLFAGILVHDDVRRWLDRTGGRLFGRREAGLQGNAAPVLVQAMTRMAHAGTGALIVLPGDQDIEPEVHGGVVLEGRLTVPLLLSLFDPGSPGHDGAVVIRGGKVSAFGVHLPLSEEVTLLEGRGTRHAAALGLSERTDALCLVVSEERGEVSVAEGGMIRPVDAGGLRHAIRAHGGATRAVPLQRPRTTRRVLAGQALLSFVLACVGWLTVVAGGEHATRTFDVGVQLENMPEGMEVRAVVPATVRVVLSGSLRSLLLTHDEDVHLDVDGHAAALGRRTFTVSPEDVYPPDGLEVVEVLPHRVRVDVESPARAENRSR